MTLVAAGLLAAMTPGVADAEDTEVASLAANAAEAHAHLMRGDIAAYRQAIALAPDFMLMDPFGGTPTGVPASDEHWQRIGRFFRDGKDAEFQLLNAYRADGMVVLVANERAHVAIGALPAQDWTLRVTLVFRQEDGGWYLAHRHADPLAKGISLAEAGRITRGDDR